MIRELIVRKWRKLFPQTIREFQQIYCSVCDGRIWPWQKSIRLYSLGMTRTHLGCGSRFVKSELEKRGILGR